MSKGLETKTPNEMGHHLDQAGLELLTSGDLPTSASQSAEVTGVSHHTRLFEVDIDLKLPIPLPPNDAEENESFGAAPLHLLTQSFNEPEQLCRHAKAYPSLRCPCYDRCKSEKSFTLRLSYSWESELPSPKQETWMTLAHLLGRLRQENRLNLGGRDNVVS
ncbi:Protein GVQW1 [Plecturocebus cupreus]